MYFLYILPPPLSLLEIIPDHIKSQRFKAEKKKKSILTGYLLSAVRQRIKTHADIHASGYIIAVGQSPEPYYI